MTIEMQRRALYIPVLHIDANLINARQKLQAVNQLEKWADDEIICMNMSSTARNEARAGYNSNRIQKANEQIHTLTPPPEENDPQYQQIEAAILVTSDGGSKTQPVGILGNRHKLKNILTILSPDEAVSFVHNKIHERDNFNK